MTRISKFSVFLKIYFFFFLHRRTEQNQIPTDGNGCVASVVFKEMLKESVTIIHWNHEHNPSISFYYRSQYTFQKVFGFAFSQYPWL
jgi:hypothetical protein